MSTTRHASARQTASNAAWIVVLLAATLVFLSSCAQPGSPRDVRQTEPTSQVEPDENEADEHENERERDEREAEEREGDENEPDESERDEREADEREADENEGGRDEA